MISYCYTPDSKGILYQRNGKKLTNYKTGNISHIKGLRTIKNQFHNAIIHEINSHKFLIRSATYTNTPSKELFASIELSHTLIRLHANTIVIDICEYWPGSELVDIDIPYIAYKGIIEHLADMPTRRAIMYGHFNRLSILKVAINDIKVGDNKYKELANIMVKPDTRESFIEYFEAFNRV